jgi:hypothetical protein
VEHILHLEEGVLSVQPIHFVLGMEIMPPALPLVPLVSTFHLSAHQQQIFSVWLALLAPMLWGILAPAPLVQPTLPQLLAQASAVLPITTQLLVPQCAQRVQLIHGVLLEQGSVLLMLGTLCWMMCPPSDCPCKAVRH